MKINIIDNKILDNTTKSQRELNKSVNTGLDFETILENINQKNVFIQGENHNEINKKHQEDNIQSSTENNQYLKFSDQNSNTHEEIDNNITKEKGDLHQNDKELEEKQVIENFNSKNNNISREKDIKDAESLESKFVKKTNDIKDEQKNVKLEKSNKNQPNITNSERDLHRIIENTEIKKRNISKELNSPEIVVNLSKEDLKNSVNNIDLKKRQENQKEVTKITVNPFLNNLLHHELQFSMGLKSKIHNQENPNQKQNHYKNTRLTTSSKKNSVDLVQEVIQKEIQKNQQKQNHIQENFLENQNNKKEFFDKENIKSFQNTKIEIYQKVELKPKFEHNIFEQKNQPQNFMNFSLNMQKQVKLESQNSIEDTLQKTIKDAIDEIISKAKIQIGNQQFSAQIRLNPSIFGFMSINMNYEQGSLVLKILVDNQDIYKKLQEGIDSIKNEFSKAGIQLETIQIKFKESSNEQYDPQFSMMFDSNSQGSNEKNSFIHHHERESFYNEDIKNLYNESKDYDDNEFIDRYESTTTDNEKSYVLNKTKNHIYWG